MIDRNNGLQNLGFHPRVVEWFEGCFDGPTPVQERVWPEIRRGDHVLMTAPTGSGKTLAAFLWAISRIMSGEWKTGSVKVLYVSPLKALNNDIRKNLIEPLNGIKALFDEAGEDSPEIRVMTRSGDTPQSERRSMVRRPPEILITTPESLNLILASPVARNMLSNLRLVILDEIHAVAATKRGTHLMSAVERLVLVAGEFQRVALSATVKPLEEIAAFIGGSRREGGKSPGVHHRRPVSIVDASGGKQYDTGVHIPGREDDPELSVWPSLIHDLAERINANSSTLIFTNSRRIAEKTARLLNEHFGRLEVYAHHGSLSRELRTLVEERMKAGELSAIVSTSSLELGIDIGDLDEVICLETPFSIASAVQRAGRSGHGVGEASRVRFFPLHGMDILSSAVAAKAMDGEELEETRIPSGPLDVLAQVILSMTAIEQWDTDDLYDFLTCCYSWRDLSRRSYDNVLDMLSGRYADTKIHELSPRIVFDRENGMVSARPGVLPLLYASGGTIPDRGCFQLRLHGSGALIGELDEEFVWERKLNDVFTLGNRTWRIKAMDDRTVDVVPDNLSEAMTPFWKAEPRGRSYLFCEKIRDCLDRWTDRQDDDSFTALLEREFHLDAAGAGELSAFLKRQEDATGVPLPGRKRIVIEDCSGMKRSDAAGQVVLHTFWGWEVNAPFALALSGAWEEKFGTPIRVFYSDTCILLELFGSVPRKDLIRVLSPDRLYPCLRRSLESTGLFGAAFRENAARALLIPRSTGNRRMPLWLSRLRGKKLLEAACRFDDFPILAETWRTCLEDLFDIPRLLEVLEALDEGNMDVVTVRTPCPSPFAAGVFYQHTNFFMYEYDTPNTAQVSRLGDDYIRDLVSSSELRPAIPDDVIRAFECKIQRIAPGYAPDRVTLVLDWIRQRRFLTRAEWAELLEAVERDHGLAAAGIAAELDSRIRLVRFSGAGETLVALNAEARKLEGFSQETDDIAPLVNEWLSWYGPVSTARIRSVFGLDEEACGLILAGLIEEGSVIHGPVGETPGDEEVCSARSLEILLRLKRRMARPAFEPLPPDSLASFLARWSGLSSDNGGPEAFRATLERLLFYPAEASLWEEDVLPARIRGYDPRSLDDHLNGTGLSWTGCGRKRLFFMFDTDGCLVKSEAGDADLEELFPHTKGAFAFWDLKDYSGLDSAGLHERLWNLVWKGRVTASGFDAVREAVDSGFRTVSVGGDGGERRASRRGGLSRWERSRQVGSIWRVIDSDDDGPSDLIEDEERNQDRIRILLGRYGVLSRPLLEREMSPFRWKNIFPSLRLMEFSGEVTSGIFFQGLPGPQFASPEAVRILEGLSPGQKTYWMNACDPASLCGVVLEGYPYPLPRRVSSNHLVYRGTALVMTSSRNGRDLLFHLPPEDPRCLEGRLLFDDLLSRALRPRHSIKTETVNGLSPEQSPYLPVLEVMGFRQTYGGFVLRKGV